MRVLLLFSISLLAASPAPAWSNEPDDDGDARPWAVGVSEDAQARARVLFSAGNALFAQSRYAQALSTYREAIDAWDHPAIRLNMAAARIELDQPLAAYEDLERALRFGESPLSPIKYAQALTYKKLLLGQLAELRIVCREPDARVLLDGKELLVGPGVVTRVVFPGPHQLVASKLGHATMTRALALQAGRLEEQQIDVVAERPPPRVERRFATWFPWTVVASGAALALAGIPLQVDAAARFDDYDRNASTTCPMKGCPRGMLDSSIADMKSTAKLENTIAIGLFATGAAIGATGVVLLVLNQPRIVEAQLPAKSHPVSISPIVGKGITGLSFMWTP